MKWIDARGSGFLPGWVVGATLLVLLALPWSRAWLEASMTRHMLVQMPLLAAAGFVLARALSADWRERLRARAGGVVPCLLLAMATTTFWMIPRALDLALEQGSAEAAKFLSLPLLAGVPLALAWPHIGIFGRGFVWSNLASMLAVLGWLYRAAPIRVCNAYGETSQFTAGTWMIVLAVTIFAAWLASLLLSPAGSHPPQG